MLKIPIVTDKKILRTKCTLSDDPEKTLAILKENFNKKKYIGLSAIQLGIDDRVAVIYDKEKKEFIDIIDWKVQERNLPFNFADETCLSLPGKAYLTPRYRQVSIIEHNGSECIWYYGDEEEHEFCKHDIGVIALQQELDHMDGILLEDIAISERDIPIFEQHISTSKVGRNDKCPCGSGKKYKKCCLGKG